MKHYFNSMSRALTSDWMLRELDAEHERIIIDIQAGEQNSPEYRAINPMSKVPTLVDGDIVITEAAAICAYLADKLAEKGFAPSPGSPERGRYYRYLFFSGTTLEPLLSVTSLGIENIKPQTMGWGDMPRVMAAVESMTPATDWALGETFTAADVVFGGTLAFFCGFNMMTASPKVASYVERIKSRTAYQESYVGF
ncbi:MAG: glutathione S-transferase family protein [Cyanobacteria bacterium P01_A01_bin.17]